MKMVPKIQMSTDGCSLSKIVQGYMNLERWQLSRQACLTFIKQHVEMGITSVDHSPIYGNANCEALFGNALKLEPSLRNQIEIISKCGIVTARDSNTAHYDSSKKSIIASVESSLTKLGIAYLDVLLLHRSDYLMCADEVVEAFEQLRFDGKVKYFGVSNFNTSQFELLQSQMNFPLITNQVELNPINLQVIESGILEKLQKENIYPMAWSPLGGGQLFQEHSQKIIQLNYIINEIAQEMGVKAIDQVVYAWVMKLPAKPLIVLGSGDVSRIASAVDALNVSISHEQWYRVLAATKGYGVA